MEFIVHYPLFLLFRVALFVILGKTLQWSRNVQPFDRLFDRYGPVVRLRGPFGGDLVLLNRPEHMEAVYKQEGRFPVRSSLDCVEHYRREYRRYQSPGPFIM